MLALSPRIDSMLSKRCFNRLAMFLILMTLLYAGAQFVICKDSAVTWKDNATGLVWAVKENGSDIGWAQANNYCKNLALEGHRDWRLPTLKELETLYDKNLSKEFKAKDPIELTESDIWTEISTSSGDAWIFNFSNGGSILTPTRGGCSTQGRALCVSRPKE
jgi:hypothetical protein